MVGKREDLIYQNISFMGIHEDSPFDLRGTLKNRSNSVLAAQSSCKSMENPYESSQSYMVGPKYISFDLLIIVCFKLFDLIIRYTVVHI